jgi:HlyD family secretion protein
MYCKLIYLGFPVFLFACGNKLEQTKPITQKITESVYASGIVKSKNQYQVFATTSGIINKLLVAENDLVRQNMPLLMITDETAEINRENASLASNYASIDANRERLMELKNNIDFAISKFRNDSLIFTRQQNLWNQGIGSKIELEQKELNFLNAKTQLAAAQLKYKELYRQLAYNAAQSNNNLAISQFRKRDLTIKSQVDGKVYALFKKNGEMVSPQMPIAIIGDANDFLLELQIDEYDIAKIAEGQIVWITMDSYKNEIFEAQISKINPLMNERTKSFVVEAKFVKRPSKLYPNLTVEANIVIQTKEKALTIQRSYLVDDSFVLNKEQKKVPVSIGLKDFQQVEIIKGLNENDIIYKPKQ